MYVIVPTTIGLESTMIRDRLVAAQLRFMVLQNALKRHSDSESRYLRKNCWRLIDKMEPTRRAPMGSSDTLSDGCHHDSSSSPLAYDAVMYAYALACDHISSDPALNDEALRLEAKCLSRQLNRSTSDGVYLPTLHRQAQHLIGQLEASPRTSEFEQGTRVNMRRLEMINLLMQK